MDTSLPGINNQDELERGLLENESADGNRESSALGNIQRSGAEEEGNELPPAVGGFGHPNPNMSNSEPIYQEDPNGEWVPCDSSLYRYVKTGHFLDKVTPKEWRNWPAYRPGKSLEPTKFERTDLAEMPADSQKNRWAHIDPYGGVVKLPAIWEVEVSDTYVVITKTYADGNSTARILELKNVLYADFVFRAPTFPRCYRPYTWLMNLKIVRFIRTQQCYSLFVFLSLLLVLMLAARRGFDIREDDVVLNGTATGLVCMETVFNFILVCLSYCRDRGRRRGESWKDADEYVPYTSPFPQWVSQKRQVAHVSRRKKEFKEGHVRDVEGRFQMRYADITAQEYDKARRGRYQEVCHGSLSFATFFLLCLLLVTVGTMILCSLVLFETLDDYGHIHRHIYIAWEVVTYTHFCLTIMGILVGAIVTLPVLFLDCAPVPSCVLKLYGEGSTGIWTKQQLGNADLGDIENAKQAAAYIMTKKQELVERMRKR